MEGFKFDIVLRKLQDKKLQLPKALANIMQRHFKRNFAEQGFVDETVEKWEEVKRRTPGEFAYKYGLTASRTNPILQGKGSGKLRHSIQIITANWNQIRIGTVGDVVNKYAAVHNEGLEAGRTRFTMPKRQFIGHSQKMFHEIEKRIIMEINQIFV